MASNFRVYRASAGSGKTFTLVKEYLALALATDAPDRYRSILAITFTNKAADEMRNRVVGTLHGLSLPNRGNARAWLIGDLLCQQLRISPDQLTQRAGASLNHMLHHYGELGISTIDRFTHRVVRTFARDLGLSTDFELELDTQSMIDQIVDGLLMEVGTDTEVTNALMDLLDAQIENERTSDLTTMLQNMAKAVFSEDGRLNLIPLEGIAMSELIGVRQKLYVQRQQTLTQIKAAGTEALRLIAQAGLQPQELKAGNTVMTKCFLQWAADVYEAPSETALRSADQGKWLPAKPSMHMQAAVDGIGLDLARLMAHGNKLLVQANGHALIIDNIYGVALLKRLNELLAAMGTEQHKVHISELNHRVAAVVSTEPAPFVYERLGVRYRNFMIDEFQDTSVLQWLNMLPLVHEGLSKGEVSLVVGDGKQAIYRWRNGEVEQFNQLPKVYRGGMAQLLADADPYFTEMINEREAALTTEFDHNTPPLNQNFRSQRAVVEFNNALFASVQGLLPQHLAPIYKGSAQQHQPSKINGLVEIRFLPYAKEEDTKASEAYAQHTLELVHGWVQECMAAGYRPSDIAILIRGKKEAQTVADHFTAIGFDVLSDDSLRLAASPQVKLLVALLRYVYDPHDPVNNAHVAALLLPNNDLNTLASWVDSGRKEGVNLGHVLNNRLNATALDALASLDLYSQLEWLRASFIGETTDAYAHALINHALRLLGTRHGDLEGFLEFWEEKKDSLSLTGDAGPNAIRIMTVHKSKGLEFPVVMHPFCDYEPAPHKNKVWDRVHLTEAQPLPNIRLSASRKLSGTPHEPAYQRELEQQILDTANLLYVALTRAEERLYVSAKCPPKDAKSDAATYRSGQMIYKHLLKLEPAIAESMTYRVGTPAAAAHHAPILPTEAFVDAGGPGWQARLRLHKSAPTPTDVWQPRRFGTAMHKALEQLQTANHVDQVVQSLLNEGLADRSDVDTMRQVLDQLVSHPEMASFFSPEANTRTEADILLADGTWARPDRVLLANGTAHILDYKTGMPDPKHADQVRGYMQAMQQLGYTATKGWLYYLETAKAVEVGL